MLKNFIFIRFTLKTKKKLYVEILVFVKYIYIIIIVYCLFYSFIFFWGDVFALKSNKKNKNHKIYYVLLNPPRKN